MVNVAIISCFSRNISCPERSEIKCPSFFFACILVFIRNFYHNLHFKFKLNSCECEDVLKLMYVLCEATFYSFFFPQDRRSNINTFSVQEINVYVIPFFASIRIFFCECIVVQNKSVLNQQFLRQWNRE